MINTLTSRERLERILRGNPVDRAPIRLWGVDPLEKAARPCWQFLPDLVNEFQLDNFFNWSPTPPPCSIEIRQQERETDDPEWYERVVTYCTPAGDLTRVILLNRAGKPGYTKKHLIESVEDARRWLSIPDDDLPGGLEAFPARVAEVGDRGMVMTGLGQAMYTVNDATGSELWGYWLYDERELIHEMVSKVSRHILKVVKHYLAAGIGPLFGWVGPELCIPPLASPVDFDEFSVCYDKPVIDLIHDAGGLVWIHCHGDMHPVLERFADLGVDCLNPIEPPPIGKLTLADAKRRVGDRMTLEGGIEVGAFELETADTVADQVEQAMAMGKPGGRLILCPSSDHSHWPDLSEHIAQNYRVFVETAVKLAPY
jgi:hypothetical protein